MLAEYFRDSFQNISYRLTLGAGDGYSLLDTANTDWGISAGPGFRYTKFENIEPGKSVNEWKPALWASTDYEHEINSKMDLILGYSTVIGIQGATPSMQLQYWKPSSCPGWALACPLSGIISRIQPKMKAAKLLKRMITVILSTWV
jgi:hypothetical protein